MRFRALLSLATVAALIVAGSSSAYAGSSGYDWGMTVNPTPIQQTADVKTAGTVFDYGHAGPSWVYVTPWMHPWDPNWAGPSCNTIRYHNGVEEGSQQIGAGAPAPYVWSLNMTAPVTWKITVTCPLPQGATGTPTIDVTFSSELPPAPPSPSASPAITPTPTPTKVTPVAATPRPTPKPVVVAPVALVAPPVLPVADTKPAPTPIPVATPVVAPTPSASPSPSFAAVPRAAVTHSRGFHVTFIEFLGFLVLVAGLLAARWHWAWI